MALTIKFLSVRSEIFLSPQVTYFYEESAGDLNITHLYFTHMGVATISRLLEIIGHFCKRAL